MVPPHSGQVHLNLSLSRKAAMPEFLIFSRFSIMLILYLVRYLLSRFFNLGQGNFSHLSEQKSIFLSFRILQCIIVHFLHESGLPSLISLQPRHLFFSLRCPIHIPQFIPHGAISESSSWGSIEIVLYFVFFRAAPTVIVITGITIYLNPIWVK